LIELGAKSNESGREKDWNTWIENATELTFPRFHFRLPPFGATGEKLGNYYCSRLPGETVRTGNCAGHSDTSRCFAVYADEFTVQNSIVGWREGADKITCYFNITGYNVTVENSNIGWSIEGPHRTFSSPFSNTLWIEPRVKPGAWVYLQKRIISPMNNLFSESAGVEVWEKSFLYHTTERNPGSYTITTLLSTFRVDHREQTDTYNGWMAVGGIGGFAFFMVILHTITMIFFGIFLPNESRFLIGSKKP